MYFGMFDPTIIILIPAMLFTFYAQSKVQSAYRRYVTVRNMKGMTGAEAARKILDANGLKDIPIEITQRELSDHYDPRARVMRLSPRIYNEPSIASISIAAHESGHAIQHAVGYKALQLRSGLAPLASITSGLAWPILMIGIFIIYAGNITQGNFVFNIGILLFLVAVVFQAITLPVEFDASNRAIVQMEKLGIIREQEKSAAKSVLSAAAMTYIAALAASIANLIRLILISRRND